MCIHTYIYAYIPIMYIYRYIDDLYLKLCGKGYFIVGFFKSICIHVYVYIHIYIEPVESA